MRCGPQPRVLEAATLRVPRLQPCICLFISLIYIEALVYIYEAFIYKVLARRMKRMKQAAAERGAKPCTGLTMPAPPRPPVAAMHCHETMPPSQHAASASRLVAPPHPTANSPRPPSVPPAEREPTLHIPEDVLRHLRRGDGTLLGAPPPPPLQPHVLEAATPRVGGCNPMC